MLSDAISENFQKFPFPQTTSIRMLPLAFACQGAILQDTLCQQTSRDETTTLYIGSPSR